MSLLPIQPRYNIRDPREVEPGQTSIAVLRASDNALFLAFPVPSTVVQDPDHPEWKVPLTSAILPIAGVPISRILNHPNIISLVDLIMQTNEPEGSHPSAGPIPDMAVFEDMTAGSLSYLLPPLEELPPWSQMSKWHALAAEDFNRFSLPESLCWHVLGSIARALNWLHHGLKETEGIPGDWMAHDDDWMPILIRDVSPAQIWFKRATGGVTYGECKLGGFGKANVTGFPGADSALTSKILDASLERQFYWAPVCLPFLFVPCLLV